MSAVAAKGFSRSWLELDAYLLNILRVCDTEGERDCNAQSLVLSHAMPAHCSRSTCWHCAQHCLPLHLHLMQHAVC